MSSDINDPPTASAFGVFASRVRGGTGWRCGRAGRGPDSAGINYRDPVEVMRIVERI
jgi:hypothetical protein